ncbi:MAG: hypothetical protein K9K88_09010 [Desulfobacterales bacterium]|nr:hypothetical protein [Desulfobacterales bacterium]
MTIPIKALLLVGGADQFDQKRNFSSLTHLPSGEVSHKIGSMTQKKLRVEPLELFPTTGINFFAKRAFSHEPIGN